MANTSSKKSVKSAGDHTAINANIANTDVLIQKSVQTARDYTGGKLPFLTEEQTRRLVASIVKTESHGGDLNPKGNPDMYGRYQLSAVGVVDIGFLNRTNWFAAGGGRMTTEAKREFVNNPSNWNHGLNKEKFLASAEIQDKAFAAYTNNNYRYGLHDKFYTPNTDPIKIMAILKAQHLVGTREYRNEGDLAKDGNRVTAGKYKNDILKNNDGLDDCFDIRKTNELENKETPKFNADNGASSKGFSMSANFGNMPQVAANSSLKAGNSPKQDAEMEEDAPAVPKKDDFEMS